MPPVQPTSAPLWKEDQLHHVLESVYAYASGEFEDPQSLERAVEQVLVMEDTDQYDEEENEDDDDDEKKKKKKQKLNPNHASNETPQTNCRTTTDHHHHTQQQQQPFPRTPHTHTRTATTYTYEHIPLGTAGAHMLVTFGAGPAPLPETVQTALQLTRTGIRHAVQQAHDLHAQRQEAFVQARRTVRSDIYKSKDSKSLHACSSEWQYRVLIKHDPAARQSPWFDLEDLQSLFPEQVHAYLQWNQRLVEYQRNKQEADDDDDDDDKDDNEGDEDEEDEENLIQERPETTTTTTTTTGGHLVERAAHFDQRTCRMKDDWYLQFAQVIRTKGSFLPARDPGLHSSRFWHWIRHTNHDRGEANDTEDPTEEQEEEDALSFLFATSAEEFKEPHPILSKAMAFLAFDFLGRIIEQAIFYKTQDHNCTELPAHTPLTPDDLYRAVQQHPELKELTASFFRKNDTNMKKPKAPQLYFGPGFEVRLEMELEEMLAHSSKEEQNIMPTTSHQQDEDPPRKRARL